VTTPTSTHTVTWDTASRVPVSRDLTHYWVQIERPDGTYVAANVVPLRTTSQVFTLPPGDYVETVSASNLDGSVREGTIRRPFVVAGEPDPVSEPFPFPVWADATPEPPPDGNGPDKTVWENGMVEWGILHGDYLTQPPPKTIDDLLNHVYYDMARVMYQIADYVEVAEPWGAYAKDALHVYRDQYVLPNNGAVPGYQNFTTGLRMDYERTGDEASKTAAILLSNEAMYASDWTDPNYVTHHSKSREVAYALLAYINAERLGQAKREIRARYVTQSYAYFDQWYDTASWGEWQVSPFMAAITCQALIADWEETDDPRCLPAVLGLGDWLWVAAYDPPTHAMLYQLNPDCASEGGLSVTGAPDLNMIIAPLYAWLWAMTGDALHRDRFDELLLGQASAYLAQGKQFDQNYWWAFDGMAWRETGIAP
jgi:hypothetical protein